MNIVVGITAVDEMATAMVVEENMEVVVAAEFVVVVDSKKEMIKKAGGVKWKSMFDAVSKANPFLLFFYYPFL
ncbi:uncharacterized protein DS421_6g184920 [Arachis hypogaea]|nr:uncharacterized protein DS421_6g184920 [Arachis hypogaea]